MSKDIEIVKNIPMPEARENVGRNSKFRWRLEIVFLLRETLPF